MGQQRNAEVERAIAHMLATSHFVRSKIRIAVKEYLYLKSSPFEHRSINIMHII